MANYVRQPHYVDEDDGLNLDVSPLSELVELVTVALREMFAARSPGNYRWVGGGDHPDGDPELSELMITESDHRTPEVIDRLPVVVVSISGAQYSGLDYVHGLVPDPLTGEVKHSDLVSVQLIFRACSSVGTEALRLAEFVRGYLVVFRDFFVEKLGLHDVSGAGTISDPRPSSPMEGSSSQKWTEVVIATPIKTRYTVTYDYSRGSAFRRMRDRVILAIENRLEGVFAVAETTGE